jgi:hypothetical protein
MSENDGLGIVGKCIVNFIFVVIPCSIFLFLVFMLGAGYGDHQLRVDALKHHVAEYYLTPDNKVGWRWIK